MKTKILILFIIMVACISCRPLKQVKSSENLKESVRTAENKAAAVLIDTTKNSSKEVKVVKVEFYPDVANKTDTVATRKQFVTIDGNRYEGSIKTATVTTTSKAKEQKGITKSDSTVVREVFKTTNKQLLSKDSIAKDPYRWRWYLGILIVLSGIGYFIYRKFFRV